MWYTLYMADKVPVQDELSKRLAELIWCFAGTEEEDEYAGQVYLALDEGEREDFGSGGAALGAGDEDGDDEDGDDEEDDDDSYEVQMEEIVNTLESSDDEEGEGEYENDNDNENEDEADEIDDALQKHCRGAHLASLYVRTFFRTMRREWGNVDKHRIDKFYTAMRLVLAEVYKYMARRHWNLGIIRLFNDTLFEEVLSQVPNGLRYHLIDITIAELATANKDAELPLTEATFLDCLEPYFALAQSAEDKIVQKRIVDNVLTKFLMEFSVVSDNAVEADDDESGEAGELIFREVHVGSVAKFIFEMASDSETDDRYRAGLYELHKTYQRRVAAIGRDVDLEDGSNDDDDDDEAAYGASMSDEDEEDEEEDMPEPPKSKSKKNKKGKTAEKTPKSKPPSSKKKDKSRSKNSKKSDAADNDETDVDENVTSQVVDPADFITPKKKTKKEKKSSKKKKSKADAAAEETGAGDSDEEDEVVNISVKEQKKAAKASAKKTKSKSEKKPKKKERKLSIEEQEEEERRKSVSFGAVNHSKSHKASMKDLKHRDIRSTAVMTPDKSILHKRNVQSADGKSKKDGKGKRVRGGAPATEPRKRRAVDYF